MTEELHEKDSELYEEDGHDEGSCGEVDWQLCKVIGVEGEIESFKPIKGNLAEVLVVADVVTLLKSEKMPDLYEFGRWHDNYQILKGSYKHSENENVVDNFSYMELFT